MDTRSTTRARTGSNRGTVQTTNNTEPGTEVNGPLSNAANAAENGADNTMANIDTDRENRDPGITDESIDDGPGQVNVVHNDTRNTADNRANTASEEKAAGSEHGENNVIAQAEARVWSDRLAAHAKRHGAGVGDERHLWVAVSRIERATEIWSGVKPATSFG